jgi:hypothetical protein
LTARRAHFPPKEHAFSPWWPFWGFRTVHNPTVVIPFSHSVDGVSSPVRDHGGLTRVPLRTDPSVLTQSVHLEKMDAWTRLRDSLARRTGFTRIGMRVGAKNPTAMAKEPPH